MFYLCGDNTQTEIEFFAAWFPRAGLHHAAVIRAVRTHPSPQSVASLQNYTTFHTVIVL